MIRPYIRLCLWAAALSLAGTCFAVARFPRSSFDQQDQQQNSSKQKNKKNKNGQNNANDSGQNRQASNPPANASNSKEKPAPLFGGTLNLKSSRQTSDSATMGFNGVDPNGQVQSSFLTASPTGTDMAKAQEVASYSVSQADLTAFLHQGGLNTATTQKSQR